MSIAHQPSNIVSVAAVGDIATGHNPPESAFSYVKNALQTADIRFGQVEKLYTRRGSFAFQSGSLEQEIRQAPETAAAFASVPFDVLSLASNHTGDWGPEAAADTFDTFRDLGIPTVGSGHNIAQARESVVIERRGLRIAFLGYCSVLLPQFWATETRAGCTPMRAKTFYEPYEFQPGSPAHIITIPDQEDLDLLTNDVRKAKQTADVVVVSLHWGLHYVHWVQDYQPIVAHAAIDAGASAIIGHHPHQPHAVEMYKDAIIFYSLGNFAFHRRGGGLARCWPNGTPTHKEIYSKEMEPGHHYDYRRHWPEGGIAHLDLDRSGVKRVTYTPTFMNPKGQPEVVTPDNPQFETSRIYLEWLGQGVKGGISKIGTDNGRYVLFDHS